MRERGKLNKFYNEENQYILNSFLPSSCNRKEIKSQEFQKKQERLTRANQRLE